MVVAQAKEKLQTTFTYGPLATDVTIRYFFYIAWRHQLLPSMLFWFGQLVLIPAIILYWRGTRDRQLVKHFGVPSNKDFEVAYRARWIAVIVIVTIHNVAHGIFDVKFQSTYLQILVSIVVGALAFAYTVGLGMTSSTGKLADAMLDVYKPYDIEDENDRLLTRLQTELADLTRKVESYTIESTLIGAISFSGFLTIVTTDKGDIRVAHNSIQRLLTVLSHLGTQSGRSSAEILIHYPSESAILSVAAFNALVCSMFFMGVIIARLRFNATIGAANFSTQMAANFNAKEEELVTHRLLSGNPETTPAIHVQRLERLRSQISTYLDEARVEVDQMRPIISYMTAFRTLGLLAFLATLVTSALWFGPKLSVCFALIALVTFVYPSMDALIRDGRMDKHDFFRLSTLISSKKNAGD
jgi:hypothetical protein